MGSLAVPASRVDSVYVGSTTVSSPLLMLVINGVVYPNGYRIEYSTGYRNFFASYTASNGYIYVECQSVAYASDLPAMSLTGVEVLVVG